MTQSPQNSTASASATRSIWLVMTAICSVQLGSASTKSLFDVVSPTAAAWLRLSAAALVLVVLSVVTRVRRAHRSRGTGGSHRAPVARNWRDGALYALVLVGMNWSFYTATSKIPLGIAVTIEFLGPLTIAVLGSRRLRDLAWPVLALTGVALLGLTPTKLDPVGVLFALLAASCWGGYIIFSTRVGRTWNSLDALTLGCGFGAVALAFPAISQSGKAMLDPHVLLVGAAVGMLSSVLPYSLEMNALRTMPPRLFGILMSIEPAVAALVAWVMLGERLHLTDFVAMSCVVAASVGATRTSGKP